ncbi:MAG: iron ABC transporter permease [Oscillospiraceae bacterium]|jgi:iron complex transport system permease protein|nr:iron ABC transporter permease [Oscillospiraceae bacterium]
MKSLRRSCIRNWFPFLLLVLLFVIILVSLAAGAANLSFSEFINALLHPREQNTQSQILWLIRMPRIAANVVCGASLAVSGLMVQTLLSNPLASPTLLGINSGAGLAVALCGAFLSLASGWTPAFAFGGAVLASLLIFAVSARTGSRRGTILLAGVAIGSILSAGIDAVHTFYPESLAGYRSFMIGGFSGITWSALMPAVYYVAAGLAAATLFAGELDVFVLGDETAASLGMRVPLARGVILTVSSVLAGASVSVCGLLGFVGLMTPHLARRLCPAAGHRRLLPVCALLGAVLVTFCDLLSRMIFAPYELPAGILLSFLGGPFFLYLLLRKKKA